MIELLKKLCLADGVSGNENNVSKIITEEIKDYAEVKTDALGNIIAFKKGKKTPEKKVMLYAHTDEVGFIVKSITDEGYLKFEEVGGVDERILLSSRVFIGENKIPGNRP